MSAITAVIKPEKSVKPVAVRTPHNLDLTGEIEIGTTKREVATATTTQERTRGVLTCITVVKDRSNCHLPKLFVRAAVLLLRREDICVCEVSQLTNDMTRDTPVFRSVFSLSAQLLQSPIGALRPAAPARSSWMGRQGAKT